MNTMPKNALIAYGSRYGSTEEISQKITEILEEKGITTRLVDLKKTKKQDWPTPKPFDAIIVGSSIRAGQWMKEPKEFLNKHKETLKRGEKILGVFVSSGYASIPQQRPEKIDEYIGEVMAELEIETHIADAFGAVLDFTPSSRLGFIDKQILKLATKELTKETGTKIDEKGRTDLRDWGQIQSYAEQFAKLMKPKN